jgi:hypothetical protein
MMTLFQSGIHFIFNFVSTLLSLGRVAVADWRQIDGRLAADWRLIVGFVKPRSVTHSMTKEKLQSYAFFPSLTMVSRAMVAFFGPYVWLFGFSQVGKKVITS